MEIRYLSVQEVIAINVAMIQRYSPGEHVGIKESGLLESAILRPRSSSFGDDAFPSLFDKATAFFESLGMNHPFQNANKRTAFASLVIFLQLNGYRFVMNQKDAEDMTVDMVNHKYSFQELSALIEKHCVKV
jgi:death-on-curing protein